MKKHYCKDCKKPIYRQSKRCMSCAGKQTSKRQLGKNNPSWNGGRPKCITCGKELQLYTAKRCQKCYHKHIKDSEILKGRIKTKIWRNKIRKTMLKNGTSKGINNPMFGKITHGKGAYYKKIWMRSSYEIAYAKWLDRNNIGWIYEPKVFDLGDTTYTPDFYLPGTYTYVEIKGFWRDDAKKKFKLFKKLYKKINLQILDCKLLKSMEVL